VREESRWATAGVFLAATVLTAGPPLALLAGDGTLGAFRSLAADAFYYLAVADHSQGAAGFTFDGEHATSGFHPLWQWLLTWGFGAFAPDPEAQVVGAFVASAAGVALGTGLFAVALLRHTGRPALAVLAAVPGFFFPLVAALNRHTGAPWSYANGMESGLSILFFGALAWLWLGRGALGPDATPRRLLLSSLLLTLLTLSRLDDVFLFAPFLLLVFVTADSRRAGWRRAGLAALLPTVVLGAYLAYNLLAVGSLLPSSGASKAQPLWGLARNGYALLTTLLPFADLRDGPDVWADEAWRVLQMLVPGLLAAVWLVRRPFPRAPGDRDPARWRNAPLAVLAGYTVLKGGYNFAMVGLWNQGEWYYPLCVLTFNALLASEAGDALDRRAGAGRAEPARRCLAGAAALAVAVASAVGFLLLERGSERHGQLHAFWSERADTRARLEQACPGCGVLAFDDGIVSYSLAGTSTLNGLGLAMDAQAQQALRDGALLDLAWSRGKRLLVSVSYAMPEEAYADPASLRRHLAANRHLEREDLERWDFAVAFRSGETRVPFVRFEPRDIGSGTR